LSTYFRCISRSISTTSQELRGEGGFEGDFGKGSRGWLEHWFE
jgi:hypothetical protein